MPWLSVAQKYPNIADFTLSRVFNEPYGKSAHPHRINNDWCNFWNLIGARGQKPCKYECEICGASIHKRGKRKYMVCQRCIQKYIQEVRWGKRVPKYHVVLAAVQ